MKAKNIVASLFNKPIKFDVYIYAPPFKRASAGVTVLYLLCDYLNRSGVPAFIVPDVKYFGVFGYSSFAGSQSLITPALNTHQIKKSISEKRIPIVIYPETIIGNPLNAANVIRYLLYYDSELVSQSCLSDSEKEGIVYYSNDIGEKSFKDLRINPLFSQRVTLPVQDPSAYSAISDMKSGVYYYAEKFINVHNLMVPESVENSAIRITRDRHDSPSPVELIKILSSAKLLHVFEDTALIYEALLAGCVVNLHPLGKFSNTDRSATNEELGLCGTISKLVVNDDDMCAAIADLAEHQINYQNWIAKAEGDLYQLIKNMSSFEKPYGKELNLSLLKHARELELYALKLKHDKSYNFAHRLVMFLIPVSYRSWVKEKAKLLSRKLSPRMKQVAIKIYTKLMRPQ
jgi:hypothetical protein